MQYLQQNLVTRKLVATKDITEERVAHVPLTQLPHTVRITTELAKQKVAPILQAACLPDVPGTTLSAMMTVMVSCQMYKCSVLCHSALEHLP